MAHPYREPPKPAPRRRRPGRVAAAMTIAAALFLSLAIPIAAAYAPGLKVGDDNRVMSSAR